MRRHNIWSKLFKKDKSDIYNAGRHTFMLLGIAILFVTFMVIITCKAIGPTHEETSSEDIGTDPMFRMYHVDYTKDYMTTFKGEFMDVYILLDVEMNKQYLIIRDRNSGNHSVTCIERETSYEDIETDYGK